MFFYLLRKMIQIYLFCVRQKYVKLCFQLLCSNIMQLTFPIPVDQSCTSALRNFSHSFLQKNFNSGLMAGFLTWTTHFTSFHNIAIGLRSELSFGHWKTLTSFCFNHSLIRWLLFWIIVLLYDPEFKTDALIFSCRICWYNKNS